MKYVVVVMSLMIGLFCSTVYAAIPLVTDDTGTQGKGKFQLELAGEYAHDKEEGVTNKDSTFSAALTYGLADTIDVVLAVPYQSLRSDEAGCRTRENGMSDLAIEAKWRLYEKDGLSLALKPGVTFPTGNDEKELGAGKMTYYLYFITSKEMAPWSFHLNLAYFRNENKGDDRKDIWHASAASTVEVMKGLKLVGDIGIETNPEAASGNSPAYILGGLIYSPAENIDIGLGVKGGLTKSETDIAVRGGVTWRF
jgi:hypothetical protein